MLNELLHALFKSSLSVTCVAGVSQNTQVHFYTEYNYILYMLVTRLLYFKYCPYN